MVSVRTEEIIGKLEKVLDFRLGEGASEKHRIVAKPGMTPATDGTDTFLPESEGKFESERDNELALANFTAHEADHIVEYDEYFGTEVGSLREGIANLVQVYHERNYTELTENPSLAGWIDNVVKDFRIDSQRRKQLPGVDRFWKETLLPAVKYLRPSTKGMSKLDAFRERVLQRTLLDKTVESVPQEERDLLEEVVRLAQSSDSVYDDPEVVKQIYGKFKDNFDITQKVKRLPSRYGTGDSSRTQGSPQQGYQGQVEQREGRDQDDKRPKQLKEGAERMNGYEENKDSYKKAGKKGDDDEDDAGNEEDTLEDIFDESGDDVVRDDKDREEFYRKIQDKCDIGVTVLEPTVTESMVRQAGEFANRYAGEIESMKRIFRQLQARHYGEKRDFEGSELDYEAYMQGELEAEVTGIRAQRRVFRKEVQNTQRAVWGIHADTSGSTRGRVIDGIKAAFYIVGNGLSTSNHNYGIYVSPDNLQVLKAPDEKWSDKVNLKIASLSAGGNGIFMDATSKAIAADLRRLDGSPRGLIVISDFEVCGPADREKAIVRELYDARIHPFLIAIGSEHEKHARELTEEIGPDHYSVIPLDRLHELPGEMFRLFKTYGIAR